MSKQALKVNKGHLIVSMETLIIHLYNSTGILLLNH